MINFQDRVMTSFHVSIGTGLMLETIFDPITEQYDKSRQVEKIDIDKFNYHFINMATVARNIITALPGNLEYAVVLKDKKFKDVFETEIRNIEDLYAEKKCKVVFYFLNYEKLSEIYNHGKFKKGEKRTKTKPILNNEAIYAFLKKIDFENDWLTMTKPLKNLDKLPTLKTDQNKMLLTTHYMCDLFVPNVVTCLDSHTGKVYTKSEFYKKYTKLGTKEMSVFPFYEHLLYYLGDTSMSMVINHKNVRLKLYDIAVNNKWNQKTKFSVVRDKLIHEDVLNPYYASFKPLYKIIL